MGEELIVHPSPLRHIGRELESVGCEPSPNTRDTDRLRATRERDVCLRTGRGDTNVPHDPFPCQALERLSGWLTCLAKEHTSQERPGTPRKKPLVLTPSPPMVHPPQRDRGERREREGAVCVMRER